MAKITGIDVNILCRNKSLTDCSIAQRMSWASGRQTTRVEDRAYCLMGIFDVKMPMLYGEEQNAFIRLQQEIIRNSDDHSIFAWQMENDNPHGLLADTPDVFADCASTEATSSRKGHPSYVMSNRGLSLKITATLVSPDTYLVQLDCVRKLHWPIGIFLRRLYQDDLYVRVSEPVHRLSRSLVDVGVVFRHSLRLSDIEVCVPQQVRYPEITSEEGRNYVEGDEELTTQIGYNRVAQRVRIKGFRFKLNALSPAPPSMKWIMDSDEEPIRLDLSSDNSNHHIIEVENLRSGDVGWLDLGLLDYKIKAVKLGIDFESNPICFVATSAGLKDAQEGNLRTNNQNVLKSLKNHFHGILGQRSQDASAWNEPLRMEYARDLEYHQGLWVLKVDRVEGLFKVRLFRRGGSEECVGSISINRAIVDDGRFKGQLVWDVGIYDLKLETKIKLDRFRASVLPKR